MKVMKGFPPAPNHQEMLANWREPNIARWSFNHVRQFLPTAPIRPSSTPVALAAARQDLDDLSFLESC
ncbi:serine hydrolase, partial [Alphaproteobacteria bacterium]|nr:serine hydrolase [Alphaproteobacteria bacterium]